ncbi:uncharacterized protein LOC110430545 [Sorghum bicolor]|uniref:BED-type domain-containing protein n=1 Tax=Sorghum bicolor TaxID=4558 RepID=A0A1B6P7Z7_SORBI|nr:uncharacterized protein LOC110430545 [Sorghum bicolor]XP_021303984.1 uncharacterized protein LOC110430545 [Sorghum bicolor]KXG21741.1 hypothetical protein SORBI_3009G102000 [Sorghum bicolor]KXG21742.1 hypothetical protein SORBI_3009G102000 [Sorghum bicolor]OQU77784.1 hypothetical protein SORBI_3009G102000 [Sorghum bicolor]|eukprot:XP_021303983.1 uncharacterized protein LOC110430545 [Sorghum bicolor]
MAMPPIKGGPTSPTSLAGELRAVAEILLRLPTPAALVRAALASRRWLQVASSPGFLRRYRSRHASSPLLGLYVPRAHTGLPSFQLADSVRSDRALAKFVRGGDFGLTGLESHPEWRLLDCHNGRLLLSRGESRAVFDPASAREPVWLPQNSPLPSTFISECLLQGHSDDAASFRVVSVQQRGHDRLLRAAEYHSHTRQWHCHQWVKDINRPQHDQAMHAGRFIFWRYDDTSSLLLDTATMEFSILGIPFTFFQESMYAIGDTEDDMCCLVGLVGSINNIHLQVWLLKANGAANMWEPERKILVSQVLGRDIQLRQVHAVTNGLALLCWDQSRQFAINLKKMCIDSEFECSALGYPLQMPWPPAVLVETNEMDQGIEVIHGCDTNESATLTKSRCGSEMVSSDHGGEKIHCHETVIQGSEIFQGIETTQDNGTAQVTPPTTSRCGNDMDHSDEMIHCNQMVICGSEMVQGIDLTHGNYTGEAAPTTSRHCSETVQVSKNNHGGLMTRCNQMIIYDREMVQGIEMTLDKNNAEVTPPTIAKIRRKNSIIWKHFTTETDSDGCTRACCKYCRRSFACSRTSGTSHLKRHLTLGSCPALKGQVPPSAGGAQHCGSGAAEKPSKRQCTYADPADDALNQNYNISYLGKMDILTEPLTTKQGNEYSIPKCLKVLHDMDDVSDEMKHLAFHILKDATNREIFMSYESRLRGLWLKKEVNKLGT